jgi:phenylalanyl-tRNA synthetase beta chain
MRVPLSWLREYVDIGDVPVDDLTERLTTAGLEVGGVEYIGVPGPPGAGHLVWDRDTIRVGRIEKVEPHPNADRLSLVTVDYGEQEPKTVVTGAPNVREGQMVAYARTGARVHNGYSEAREIVTLEPKKLRGVPSEGMVLSERELGLSDSHEGIMELPVDAPLGAPLQEYLGDIVLEIELTPNLGRAASIVGVAREVAALFERQARLPSMEVEAAGPPAGEAVRVESQVPGLNPRFVASLIRDVTIGPSPAWMQRRLTLAGMRPRNNVVDITNYVMLELGQPLHAFDYDVLVERARRGGAEVPTIITRLARRGESLVTLDDVERQLDMEDIVVTDTEGVLAIAGIMGGAESEVSGQTTSVLLEAASWDFITTRRSTMRHSLFSEASYRFTRGVHPAMALRGNQRATRLMVELCGGEAARDVVDFYPEPARPVVVELESRTVTRLLGVDLPPAEIAAYLERLEFQVERDGGRLTVTVPDHRLDVTIPADLVEEVARVYGLDALPGTLMADPLPPHQVDRTLIVEERIRDLLVAAGLTETISFSMTAPEREAALLPHQGGAQDVSEAGYVALSNPISQERRVMRRTLLASAMENLQTNLRHRERVSIFEIGLSYLPRDGEPLPQENRRLVIALTGPSEPLSWHTPESRAMDFFDAKGILDELARHLYLSERVTYEATGHPTLQPGRAATVCLDGRAIGTTGELHPLVRRANDLPEQRVALIDLDLDALIAATPENFKLSPVPRFPPVMQDLAVVVDETVPAHDVEQAIRGAGVEYLDQVLLFDVYRGRSIPEGKKSLAYSLRYLAPGRTLTDEEVAPHHAVIADTLRRQFGASIRGLDQ